MKTMNHWKLFEEFLKASKTWGCLVSYSGDQDIDLKELQKAVPLLSITDVQDLLIEHCIYLSFENSDEAERFFNTVVGDDGPTKSNPYDGPARVFACWGGPDGLMSENT